MEMSDYSEVSAGWLSALLTEKFFNACILHEHHTKNEKNVFCFNCCISICPHCFLLHPSHRLLRIRRYMYHDVIKIRDADKIMDCAQVQYYKTNSSKVVFLNQRPPTKPSKTCSSFCVNCNKNLQYSYIFCCLFCKLQHLQTTGVKLSTVLRTTNFPTFSEPGSDDGLLTPDSVLELSGPAAAESGSIDQPGSDEYHGLLISATDITRKKRSNHQTGVHPVFGPVCAPVSEQCYSEAVMNRRKGTPHRSPLY